MCYQFNTNAMNDKSDGNQSILDYLKDSPKDRIQKYSENYLMKFSHNQYNK